MSKSNKTPIARRQRLKIGGQFVGHQVALIHVLQRLSLNARRILDALEIEHCRHGGRENGRLLCPYRSFAIFGLTSGTRISHAFHELKTARLIEIIRPGRRSFADLRTPSLYRLTYLPTFENGKWVERTDEWKKPKSQDPIEPRDAVQIEPRDPQKPGSNRTASPRFHAVQIEPHHLDLGVEGGGLVAEEFSLAATPPAHPQEGAGPSAPPPPSQLPNVTAPSSGRLH